MAEQKRSKSLRAITYGLNCALMFLALGVWAQVMLTMWAVGTNQNVWIQTRYFIFVYDFMNERKCDPEIDDDEGEPPPPHPGTSYYYEYDT